MAEELPFVGRRRLLARKLIGIPFIDMAELDEKTAAANPTETQLSALARMAAGDGTVWRVPGGFWISRKPDKVGSHGEPVSGETTTPSCDIRTVRAMEKRGWVRRENVYPEEWRDTRRITDAGKTVPGGKTAARRPKYRTHHPDTRTFGEAFMKWFEGSKAVDEYGKPLLVYHGSPDTRFLEGEGVFQTPRERFLHKEDPERAFWFAADYGTASSYSDPYRASDYQGCKPGTKGFYLSLKNPYVVDNKGKNWHGTDTTVADAKAAGHDGVVIHNTVDQYQRGRRNVTDTYAVFSPSQIKTADNAVCDPLNPSVNASKTAGMADPERIEQRFPTVETKKIRDKYYINIAPSMGEDMIDIVLKNPYHEPVGFLCLVKDERLDVYFEGGIVIMESARGHGYGQDMYDCGIDYLKRKGQKELKLQPDALRSPDGRKALEKLKQRYKVTSPAQIGKKLLDNRELQEVMQRVPPDRDQGWHSLKIAERLDEDVMAGESSFLWAVWEGEVLITPGGTHHVRWFRDLNSSGRVKTPIPTFGPGFDRVPRGRAWIKKDANQVIVITEATLSPASDSVVGMADFEFAPQPVIDAIKKRFPALRNFEFVDEVTPMLTSKRAATFRLYHGTGAYTEFKEFELGHKNHWSVSRTGLYLTDDLDAAKEFGQRVITADVTMDRPLDLRDEYKDNPGFDKVFALLSPEYQKRIEGGPYSGLIPNTVSTGLAQTKEFVEATQKAGFDGIIMGDSIGHQGFESYIAFSPGQVKIVSEKTAATLPNRIYTKKEVAVYLATTWHKQPAALESMLSQLDADEYELKSMRIKDILGAGWGAADEGLIENYSKIKTPFPPIILNNNPEEGFVGDGHHRLEAAALRGDSHIMAYVPIGWKGVKTAATLPDSLRSQTYYHGTDSEKAAQEILRDGIQPRAITMPGKAKSRAQLAPVPDRVYLTEDLRYAAVYALGGDMFGVGDEAAADRFLKGKDPYGYVFEIEGADLTGDVVPDEDSIGEWLSFFVGYRKDVRIRKEIEEKERSGKPLGEWEAERLDRMRQRGCSYADQAINQPDVPNEVRAGFSWFLSHLTEKQKRALEHDPDVSTLAQIGKKLQKRISPEITKWMLSNGAHVAHQGAVMPSRAWRFDKKDGILHGDLVKWGLLEEIPVRTAKTASTSDAEYPLAGESVDGLAVRDDVPNTSSIGASCYEYEVLDGIREVPMADFDEPGPPPPEDPAARESWLRRRKGVAELAKAIEASGEINPLIVVVDKRGPYVLEGGHRFDALRVLGKKSFPAMVVMDTYDLDQPVPNEGTVVLKMSTAQRWSSPLLDGLKAEARKAPTFGDFKHDFHMDIKHGLYFHVTSDPDFRIDPEKGPRDMSSLAEGGMDKGKLMVTSHLDYWLAEYKEDNRAYVAIIDMSDVPRNAYRQVSRGFGNEFWVSDPSRARVTAVLPIAKAKALDRRHHAALDLGSNEDLGEFYDLFHDPQAPEWKPPKEQGKLPFRGKGTTVSSLHGMHNPLFSLNKDAGSFDEPFPDGRVDFFEEPENPHTDRKYEVGVDIAKDASGEDEREGKYPTYEQLVKQYGTKREFTPEKYNRFRNIHLSLGDPLVLYRSVTVQHGIQDLRTDAMGIYWSYNDEGAKPYWPESDEDEVAITVQARVPFDGVDWMGTIYSALMGSANEIVVREGTTILLTQYGEDDPLVRMQGTWGTSWKPIPPRYRKVLASDAIGRSGITKDAGWEDEPEGYEGRHDYMYETDCVEADGDDISNMVDAATEVRYKEIKSNCEGLKAWEIGSGYSPDGTRKELTLRRDMEVRYYRSVYKGIPCYYIRHSGIEYVWVNAGSRFASKTAAGIMDEPGFRRWFSGSKVVDAQGDPLPVYHGTNEPFSRVDMDRGAQGVFWVTSDRSKLERGEAGAVSNKHILKMYVSIKKPAGWDEYERLGLGELKRDYDGVILPDKDGSFDAIVFKSGQVRMVQESDTPQNKTAYSDDAMFAGVEARDDVALDILNEYKKAVGDGIDWAVPGKPVTKKHLRQKNYRQRWRIVPFARLKKIWIDYAKTGMVTDESGMEEIATIVAENVHKIAVNTLLCGHTQHDPEEWAADVLDEEVPERYFELLPSFFDDENGDSRISDFAMEPLDNLAIQLYEPHTAEEKLQIVDRILNIVHRRSDLSGWFVQGGRATLDTLFKYRGPEFKLSALKSPLLDTIKGLIPSFVKDAQGFYDRWTDPKDYDGRCDYVSTAIATRLADVGVRAYAMEHDRLTHSLAVAYDGEEAFSIDIPAKLYERPAWGRWKKVPNVVFVPADVRIDPIQNPDPSGEKSDGFLKRVKGYRKILPDYPGVADKTAAQRGVWYHGSSIKNLRSILAQGLIPDPKEKNWADDPETGVFNPSRASYGGIYVTRNLMTAASSPRDHNKEGRDVVVCMELQPSTFYLDEDDLLGIVSAPSEHASDIPSYIFIAYFSMTQPGAVDPKVRADTENEKNKYVERVVKRLKYRNHSPEQGMKGEMHPELEKRLRELLPVMWLAALTRNAAHLNDNRHSIWSNIEPDIKKAYNYVFPGMEWDKIPSVKGLLPTKEEGEAAYMEANEQLTRTLRLYARPRGKGGSRETARVTEPIGYSGSNRILAVVEVRDGKRYRGDDWKKPTQVVIHYGTIPPDFFAQYRERYGGKYVVERALEPGKVEPVPPEPPETIPKAPLEQHPLTEPWMNEEEKAQAGKKASIPSKPFSEWTQEEKNRDWAERHHLPIDGKGRVRLYHAAPAVTGKLIAQSGLKAKSFLTDDRETALQQAGRDRGLKAGALVVFEAWVPLGTFWGTTWAQTMRDMSPEELSLKVSPSPTKKAAQDALAAYLDSLRPEFARLAQDAYDRWEDKGRAGLCYAIAQAFVEAALSDDSLGGEVTDSRTDKGYAGNDHAWAVVTDGEKAFYVDIPHERYERLEDGRWRKVPGVRFSPEDIVISPAPVPEWDDDGNRIVGKAASFEKVALNVPRQPQPILGGAKQAAGEWWRRWRKTTVLKKGTILYHGTAQEFEPNDIGMPAWFSTSRSVAEHFLEARDSGEGQERILRYQVTSPIRLPRIDDREDLEALGERFGIEALMQRESSEDMAEGVADSVLPGWIIPDNYPDGDDILLVSSDSIMPIYEKGEGEHEGMDGHGLPGTWGNDEKGNSVYQMTPEEIAEREKQHEEEIEQQKHPSMVKSPDGVWRYREPFPGKTKKAGIIGRGWAIWQGKVLLDPKNEAHVDWFERLGIPNSGQDFDRIPRGNYYIDSGKEKIFLWTDADVNPEASDKLYGYRGFDMEFAPPEVVERIKEQEPWAKGYEVVDDMTPESGKPWWSKGSGKTSSVSKIAAGTWQQAEHIIKAIDPGNEMVLYHSGTAEEDKSINEIGLVAEMGEWVQEVLNGATDDDDLIEKLRQEGGAVYFDKVPRWIRSKVHRVVKHDPTLEEIRQHGQLTIVVADLDGPIHRFIGDEGKAPGYSYESLRGEKDVSDSLPFGLEPGDFFSIEDIEAAITLTGDDLLKFMDDNYPGYLTSPSGGSTRQELALKEGIGKAAADEEFPSRHLEDQIYNLAPQLAKAAQRLYNKWEARDGDGLCQAITDSLTTIIAENTGDTVVQAGSKPHVDHVFSAVFGPDEAYGVDIPYRLYEVRRNGRWEKKLGVRFSAGDVLVFPIPNEWRQLEGEGSVTASSKTVKVAFPTDRTISLKDAEDMKLFGPVWHGTSSSTRDLIQQEGFKVFEGEAGTGNVSHGFENPREYALGHLPPVHFLGYGVYFTTSRNVAKMFNGGSMQGLNTYYLNVPRMETINFNAPHTMMKWWLRNGYDPQVAKTDRVAATKLLTDSLSSRFHAVFHKGGGWKTIDMGPQIVVFDPSRIYLVDLALSKPGEIGCKVMRKADGMKGTLLAIRSIPSEIGKQYHGGAERFLQVRWQRGGTDHNVYDRDVEFVQPKGPEKTV